MKFNGKKAVFVSVFTFFVAGCNLVNPGACYSRSCMYSNGNANEVYYRQEATPSSCYAEEAPAKTVVTNSFSSETICATSEVNQYELIRHSR